MSTCDDPYTALEVKAAAFRARHQLPVVMLGSLVSNLYNRWLDERGHEDFAKYQKSAKSAVELHRGLVYLNLRQRPFELTVTDDKAEVTFFLKRTSRNLATWWQDGAPKPTKIKGT